MALLILSGVWEEDKRGVMALLTLLQNCCQYRAPPVGPALATSGPATSAVHPISLRSAMWSFTSCFGEMGNMLWSLRLYA